METVSWYGEKGPIIRRINAAKGSRIGPRNTEDANMKVHEHC